MRILLLALLVGCEPSTTVGGDSGGGGEDSDTNENIGDDTGDSADTGDTADTADTGTAEPDLAWDVEGDYSGTTFSLVSLDLDGDTPHVADILVETDAAARIELSVPPPDDLLVESADVPGLYLAFFVGGLHEDDGDGKWDPDELWYGSATLMSVYLDGILPQQLIDMGLHLGWNALVIGGEEGVTTIGDPLAQPLPILLREDMSFGGSFDETVTAADSVTSVAVPVFSGTDAPAMDYAGIDPDGWELTLYGEPPESHFADVDGDGVEEAVELFMAYTDLAGGSGFDGGDDADLPIGFACRDGIVVTGWWLAPSADITQTLYLAQIGASLGWNALALTDTGLSLLSDAQALDLTLSASCSPN